MSEQHPLDRQEADQRAKDTWAAHQALVKAEVDQPELSHNPVWQCLRMDAYEAFCRAFDGEG